MKRCLAAALTLAALASLTVPALAVKVPIIRDINWRVCNGYNWNLGGCDTTYARISGTAVDTTVVVTISDLVPPPMYGTTGPDTMVLARLVIYSDSLQGTYVPNVTALTVAVDAVDYQWGGGVDPVYHQLQSSAYTALTGPFITVPLLMPKTPLWNQLATNTGALGGIAGHPAIRLRITAVTGVLSRARAMLIGWTERP